MVAAFSLKKHDRQTADRQTDRQTDGRTVADTNKGVVEVQAIRLRTNINNFYIPTTRSNIRICILVTLQKLQHITISSDNSLDRYTSGALPLPLGFTRHYDILSSKSGSSSE